MYILTSGCSFTSDAHYPNWPAYLDKNHEVTNLAYPAAGNQYIANSIISELQRQQYDHVLVMWSGLTRLDFHTDLFDEGWRNILKDYVFFKQLPDSELAYVFSGGRRGSWQGADSLIKNIFHTQYRVSSDLSLVTHSIMEMLKLQSYLKSRNIRYHFMSYINYWTDRQYVDNSNVGVYQYPEIEHLLQAIDFDRWIFADDNKNGIYEMSIQMQDFIDSGKYRHLWKHPENRPGTHPGLKASERWANLVDQRLAS